MYHKISRFIFFMGLLLLLIPVSAQEAVAACVAEGAYDPDTDYFPDKISIEYAQTFTVDYFNHYKLVTVTQPWAGAAESDAFQYVLVQCGTPTPEDYPDAQIVTVPIDRLMALSTSYLPHLVELGVADTLIGVDELDYVSSAEVLALAENPDFLEVGSGATINIESVLNAEPDLVMAFGSGIPEYDTHPVLIEAGVPVALSADYVEATPLGRAEWLKFTALFYNAEAAAEDLFAEKEAAYNDLVALTADIASDEKPLVLWDSFTAFGGGWFIPGSDSFSAQFLQDAGARYVLEDSDLVQGQASSVMFDFETVYDAGLNADIWIPGSFGVTTLADLLAQDERYADFAALQNGQVYTNGLRLNAIGFNDYYESGLANPHWILADLIALFYPDLLPEHEFYFFMPLE